MTLEFTGRYRYPPPNPDWLASHSEPILEPSLPIIDAHHHLWEEPGNPYLGPDLLRDVGTGHNIVATVFVQCHYGHRTSGPEHLRPVGETERVESARKEMADVRPGIRFCAGIVGFADLLSVDTFDEVLDAHIAVSPHNFCGIRQSVARSRHFPKGIVLRPAPADMLSDCRFEKSLRQIAKRGLSLDAMLYHEQLPELTALAGRVDTRVILDHVGCPLGVGPYEGTERETFAHWRRDIEALSKCRNVFLKFGGFGTIVTGAARCMFESNFPVDKAMYSYEVLWNSFKRLCRHASESEKADLFKCTAKRAYRLSV